MMLSYTAVASVWDESITNADLQRQLQASQIQPLKAGEQDFMTLQLAAMTPFVRGTVVLVPDWSDHPASPRAIEYLRQFLVDYGWNTMAMMVPPAVSELSVDNLLQYQQQLQSRLQVVMAEAEKQPGAVIVIGIGHSGAVLNTLYKNADLKLPQALVLVSAAVQDPAQNELIAQAISQHSVPTLDLLASQDNVYTASSSRLRLQLVRKHVKEIYRQRVLPGSSHDNQAWLANEILGWLRYIGY
jgi:hypothetical protein